MSTRAALLAVGLWALASGTPRAALAEETAGIESLEQELERARARMGLVRDFVMRAGGGQLETARMRFSEAETQFLLENYEGCAAQLFEVIDVSSFRESREYPTALYYLAESLFQTASYLESRRYFREALTRLSPGLEYQNTLVRLMAIADRTGDFSGIDGYYEAAKASGKLRSEVVYLYAKWTSRRKDLPLDLRQLRADADFASIQPGQPYFLEALYFRGALKVSAARRLLEGAQVLAARPKGQEEPERQKALEKQASDSLELAAGFFDSVLEAAGKGEKEERVRGLATLALARVLHEQGRYKEALERYQSLGRSSPEYNDALFEAAASHVRMGNLEQALRSSEILLIVGKDSPVAPDAQLLQGNLLLQLGRFEKASEAFNELVQTYAPVRDQVNAVVQRPDPVAYFDQLLREREGALDLRSMLPKKAQGWIEVDRELEVARSLSEELSMGKSAIVESNALAEKLLRSLSAGRLSLFPQLHEGTSHAVQLSNALTALEARIVRLQVGLIEEVLDEDARAALAALDAERAELDRRFENLPRTEEHYEQRKSRFMERISELEKRSFELRRQLQGMRAELVGLQKYWDDVKASRKVSAQEEEERRSEFAQYLRLIEQLDEQRRSIDASLAGERTSAVAQAIGGSLEEELRGQYRTQLSRMQTIIAEAMSRVSAENRSILVRTDRSRMEIERLQTELGSLRAQLRDMAQLRAEDYVARVKAEQELLSDYARQIGDVEGDTRLLVGEIAFDSFSRVGRQFQDIVLKGDVGLVDVSWARKKERSDKISTLVKDRDAELTRLREQFSEVLSDAD